MGDGALSLHCDTLAAAAQIEMVAVLEHVSLSAVLAVPFLFLFASVIVKDRTTASELAAAGSNPAFSLLAGRSFTPIV